ncbi:MAG: hypothetical protein ACTSW1_02370 [Candidatus Hodarchaeales archaeon]
MIESILIIISIPIIIYILYYLFYTKVKTENEFARQVYSYLLKRYRNTSIVDYGGLSSDPIIVSSDAGPFKTLQVVVVTEKQENKEDRDIIIKGEISRFKYELPNKRELNLNLRSLKYMGNYRTKYKLGISALDTRFNLTTNNLKFAKEVFSQSDLISMIIKNYDLKDFKIHLAARKSSTIEIRMETMNANSFLQAFNLLLASVGTLTQKGFIIRGNHTHQIEGLNIPEIKQIPIYNDKRNLHAFKNNVSSQAKKEASKSIGLERGLGERKDIFTGPLIEEKIQEATIPTKEKYSDLFSSLTYRTKDIIYKNDRVIIETFSTDLPDITVKFLKDGKTKLEAISNQKNEADFELIIENTGTSSKKDWNKLWSDINITGPSEILDSLKIRSGLAHKINKIGNILIDIKARSGSNITYNIFIPRHKESIELAYEILNDIMWIVKLNT